MKVSPQVVEQDEQQERLPPAVRLENWYRDDFGHPHLCGNAYGHPRFPDGYPIYTSKLVWISATHAQTQNTLYVLGVPR